MREKLIVALDFPDFESAKNLVNKIGDEVCFYKIGLEFMMSGDYFKLIDWLKNNNKKVFADLKLYDISETMIRAIKNLSKYDIDMLTIHSCDMETMKKISEIKQKIKIIAVTTLTSLSNSDLIDFGYDKNLSIENLASLKTEVILKSGLDGIVASGLELKTLREKFGSKFIIVTPGIRIKKDVSNDDQKRVVDVEYALKNQSSYLVVGRPINRDKDPKLAAKQFNKIIDETLTNSF